MDINFRTHKPGDVGWIIAKHGEIYTSEFNFDPSFEVHIANKMVDFFHQNDPFDTIWIAEAEGDRAGSIAISRVSEQQSFINFLLVMNQYRGQKIAQRLFEKVIQHSRDHQFIEIGLETYSCLTGARKLYQQQGFEIVKINPDQTKFGQTFDQEFWQLQL